MKKKKRSCPQGAMLVEKRWGFKQDVVQTTNFINTIKLQLSEDSPNTLKKQIVFPKE